jgi:hypothetical protein
MGTLPTYLTPPLQQPSRMLNLNKGFATKKKVQPYLTVIAILTCEAECAQVFIVKAATLNCAAYRNHDHGRVEAPERRTELARR